jgi:hypothetical protein
MEGKLIAQKYTSMKVKVEMPGQKLQLKEVERLGMIKSHPKATSRNDKRFRNRPTDKLRARRLPAVVPQSSALLKFSSSHNELTLLFTRRTLIVFLQIRNRTMAQKQGRQIEMLTILRTKAPAVFKIQH